MKDLNGIWFYGLSGVGKSFASNYIFSNNSKKSIILDGDKIREYISTDLKYSIKDREIQIKRIFGLAKISLLSNIFPIISSVYMNNFILKKTKLEKILVVNINRSSVQSMKNNDTYKEKKNVLGVDLEYELLETKKIYNTGDNEFCKQLDSLIV